MFEPRIIPILLLHQEGLYKSIQFSKLRYVGDPLNTIKIFNDKGVDELVIFDIDASLKELTPNFLLIENLASECFMPICYGGGVKTIAEMKTIFNLGVEKISLNSYAHANPDFIKEASNYFGRQSIVVTVDVKKNWYGNYYIYSHRGKKLVSKNLLATCQKLEMLGVGEIVLNSIDKDGMMSGFDLELIKLVTDSLTIPVVACGGASDIADCYHVINEVGASAAAAGSIFIYNNKNNRSVLINYPDNR